MLTTVNAFLAAKGIYLLTFILFSLGLAGMIVCNNYMKKLICMNIMQVAVIFFSFASDRRPGGLSRWPSAELSGHPNT